MPYQYLDDIATADVAFRASGATLEDVFIGAAEATINVMVEDLGSIDPGERVTIRLEDEQLEMLLFQFLQELIYYKDARKLLLLPGKVTVAEKDQGFSLKADMAGETPDRRKHKLSVDIKAVTMHRFQLRQAARGWEATVVLDI